MKIIYLALAVALIGCAEKKATTSTETPVADYYLNMQDAYINSECGGVMDQACHDMFLEAFLTDLFNHYGIAEDPSLKSCSLRPQTCLGLKATELYYRQELGS